MVELKTKITESGILCVPKELREVFGHDMKIITCTTAAILFPAGISYKDVLRSLEIIKADLQFRINSDKEKSKARAKSSRNAAIPAIDKGSQLKQKKERM